MPWSVTEPATFEHLCHLLLEQNDKREFAFRGQANESWELETTIDRAFGISYRSDATEKRKLVREAATISVFRRRAKLHLTVAEFANLDTIAGTLLLMQHYGAPTRLLDWTVSPWVAAYFASISHPTSNGVIWAFNRKELPTVDKKWSWVNACSVAEWSKGSMLASHQAAVVDPMVDNARMNAQQSLFTMSGHLGDKHNESVPAILTKETDTKKIIIKREFKKELAKRLDLMNITATSLFPGILGVSEHIKHILELGIPLVDFGDVERQLEWR